MTTDQAPVGGGKFGAATSGFMAYEPMKWLVLTHWGVNMPETVFGGFFAMAAMLVVGIFPHSPIEDMRRIALCIGQKFKPAGGDNAETNP